MSEHPWGHRTADDPELRAFTPLNSAPRDYRPSNVAGYTRPGRPYRCRKSRRDILVVDAFTNRPFAGNAAAVVPDAAGLSGFKCRSSRAT